MDKKVDSTCTFGLLGCIHLAPIIKASCPRASPQIYQAGEYSMASLDLGNISIYIRAHTNNMLPISQFIVHNSIAFFCALGHHFISASKTCMYVYFFLSSFLSCIMRCKVCIVVLHIILQNCLDFCSTDFDFFYLLTQNYPGYSNNFMVVFLKLLFTTLGERNNQAGQL